MSDDDAGRAMGDAGKGSFEESQDKSGGDRRAAPPADDWRARLGDELGGKDGPKEERTHAAGPGRGRL